MTNTTLGEVLVSAGVLTEEQRQAALDFQRLENQPMSFGEVLVHQGYCTQDQVDDALRLQGSMRSDQRHVRAAAFCDVAQKSKQTMRALQRELINMGQSFVEKAGMADIPTPILGVPIIPRGDS